MAQDGMTFAESGDVLEALRLFEELERAGTIRPAEQEALDRFRARRKSAEQEQVETAATYRGAMAGATFNLDDEIAGAYAAANEAFRSRNRQAARAAYQRYRDLIRQKNEAAQLLAPEAYATGELAGGVGSMLLPGAAATRAMRGRGMLGRMFTGGAAGAAMTALPQVGGAEGGLAERLSSVEPLPTAVGGAIGAAAPAAGAAVGYGARRIQDLGRSIPGFGAGATQRVARSMQRPQTAGTDIEQYLRGLGPEGMLADVPGSPRSMAQGLATMQGEGADVLRRQIEERAAGAGPRIEQEMTTSIAGPEAAFATRRAQAQQRSGIYGPLYDAAKASDQEFNVDALRSGLVFLARDQAADVRGALNRVMRDLGTEGPISAERLHNARVALNDAKEVAFRSGAGGKGDVLKGLLEEFDNRLDQIPGYSTARSGWAATKSIDDAIDAGRQVFSGGPTSALSPAQLRQTFDKLSEPQQEAFRQGAREYLAALMGTSRSDAPAAWQTFQKGWNEEKLRIILGDEAAAPLLQRLRAEAEFSGTRSDVLKGSQTSFREEARESLADIREPDSMNRPSPVTRLRQGLEAPINRVIDEVLYGARRSNLNREIGTLLTLQGPQRDAAVRALLVEARRLDDPTRVQQILEAMTTTGLLATASSMAD